MFSSVLLEGLTATTTAWSVVPQLVLTWRRAAVSPFPLVRLPVFQAGADATTTVVAALVPNSPPQAVASAASPVKEAADVEKQKQIVNAGPSVEKPAHSKAKAKAEPKPQVKLAFPACSFSDLSFSLFEFDPMLSVYS